MELKYDVKCSACQRWLPAGTIAEGILLSPEGAGVFLCAGCHKRAGSGSMWRKVLEAWYVQYDAECGDPNGEAYHEEYYLLENLGVKDDG